MPNPTVRASADALPNSRRAFLTGIAVAPIAAIPMISAAVAEPANDEHVLALWAQRYAFRQQLTHAMEEETAAEARLPDWARSGQKMMAHDGSLSGGVCGWPAIQGMAPPAVPGVLHLVRPNEDDLRDKFYRSRRNEELAAKARTAFGEQSVEPLAKVLDIGPDNAITTFRREWRELAARLRAQTAEKEKAGQIAAQARIDSLWAKWDAIDAEILALAPETASVAAAQIIVHFNPELGSDDPISHNLEQAGTMIALAFLRPSLSGLLRAHVDEMLDNPEMPASALQAAIGFGDVT